TRSDHDRLTHNTTCSDHDHLTSKRFLDFFFFLCFIGQPSMNTASSSSATLRCAGKPASFGAGFGRRSGHCNCRVKAAAAASAGVRSPSRGDYYKVLSLDHSADVGAEEVKRAYRRLALQYHPDVCPPSRRAESTELFVELQRAYETLSDPATRVQYDAELRTGRAPTRPTADGFARDVWEAQLSVLRARSERRQNGSRCSGRRF
uniref:J domain-containing protein n=2 Tax=Aegilops tauschii subsp. strangulata TaxID=200361 RepID=A0A453KQ33_AEGTS